jgi:hypothetical protein
MGKIIPPQTRMETTEKDGDPQTGPLQARAHEFVVTFRQVEEGLDLDELDRLARRHARTPASGSAEALDALSVVVRCAPELFSRVEVNLHPSRLCSLADRERALSILCPAVIRLSDLLQDSQLEQGDEVVELLTVGCKRAEGLSAARLYSNDQLAQALDILSSYQKRVIEEGAHRSAEMRDEANPSKKKKK